MRDVQQKSEQSICEVGSVLPGVVLFKVGIFRHDEFSTWKERKYYLRIGRCQVEVTRDQAEALWVETLSDEDKCWSINEDPGDSIHYCELYPPWSVVPHPRTWVAGNIYYGTKISAQEALFYRIQKKLRDAEKRVDHRLARLQLEEDRLRAILESEGKDVYSLGPEDAPEVNHLSRKEWID